MSDEPAASVGTRRLRHELSAILDRVWNGESFEITDRGKPVARLVPLLERENTWKRLIADGKIRPATRPLHPLSVPAAIPSLRMTISEALAEQQDESHLP